MYELKLIINCIIQINHKIIKKNITIKNIKI